MKKVLAFFAEGTEEIECLMVVDILRRAGVSVELIAVAPDKLVKGSHQITISVIRIFPSLRKMIFPPQIYFSYPVESRAFPT